MLKDVCVGVMKRLLRHDPVGASVAYWLVLNGTPQIDTTPGGGDGGPNGFVGGAPVDG